MENKQELPYFERWLYSLHGIELLKSGNAEHSGRRFIEHDTLIYIVAGQGKALLNSKHYKLSKCDCFYIAACSWLQLEADAGCALEYYRLQLDIAEIKGLKEPHCLTRPLPLPDKLQIGNEKQWIEKLRQLDEQHSSAQLQQRFAAHMLLQSMIFHLVEYNIQQKNAVHDILDSIDTIHAVIDVDYSVKQLAEQANLGTRQYTVLFKQTTGLNPLDYITKVRMEHAKRQLAVTEKSVSEIAKKVGYSDVYYFSRRFKQIVGFSPRQYAGKIRRQLKIVALYYSGMAIAMGVRPIAANLSWWGGSSYLTEQEQHIINIGHSASLADIACLEPDLILLNDYDYYRHEQLQKIASTVYIPYDGHRNLFQETMLFGDILGSPEQAASFIYRYEQKAGCSRERLAAAGIAYDKLKIGIIRFENNGTTFSAFGDNYGRGGWSLYRGLQFQAPDKVQQQLIASGQQIAHQLPLHMLPDYVRDADFLFVINEGEGIRDIAMNEHWRSLPAVENKRIVELNYCDISFFDPISIEKQLELVTELFVEKLQLT